MPTTRRRRARNLVSGLTAYQRAWLLDADLPDEDSDDVWWRVVTRHHKGGPEHEGELWAKYRDELLAEFVAEHPGSRPAIWWTVDAPEPRCRLGGTGTPSHEALAYKPVHCYGLPTRWVEQKDVGYYSGGAVDLHNKPIGTEFVGRKIAGVALNPRDPPTFELQATYLKRLGLLLSGEERRLKAEDYKPEVVLPDLAEVAELGRA